MDAAHTAACRSQAHAACPADRQQEATEEKGTSESAQGAVWGAIENIIEQQTIQPNLATGVDDAMTDAETIDRTSPVPYYQQLVEILEKRLGSKQITIGQRLPSENDLRNEFGLARATVRQALQTLESRGLVQRIANRGVFASETPVEHGWMIQETQGFLENAVGHQNRSVTTRVLRSGRIKLPPIASRSLEVPSGSEGFELVRVRSLEGVPALFSVNYSPGSLAPIIEGAADVLAGTAPLSELFAGAGYSMGGAHRTVYAVTPSLEIAEHLAVSESTPLLRIRSVSWTAAGFKYDVYETWVRSDVVPLEISVTAMEVAAAVGA
jgi:GntR family transcriptional regulator